MGAGAAHAPDGLPEGSAFRRVFHLSLALKALDGVLECVAASLLLVVPAQRLDAWLGIFVARELSSHPDDWIGRAVTHLAQAYSIDTARFAIAYLMVHGIAKLFIVIAVWRERLWAFPIALAFLGFFLLYQLYRIAHTHSIALMIFSAFDLFVLWAIRRESQLLRGARGGPPAPQPAPRTR